MSSKYVSDAMNSDPWPSPEPLIAYPSPLGVGVLELPRRMLTPEEIEKVCNYIRCLGDTEPYEGLLR